MPSYAPLAPKCNFSQVRLHVQGQEIQVQATQARAPVDVPPVPGWVKTANGWGDPKLFAESAAETLAWAYPLKSSRITPSVIVVICPQPVAEPAPSPPMTPSDNENPTRKRRIIKTKSIVKKKFMETTSFTDNSERVKDPAKAHEKDLKLGAGIARSRVTSHYSERLTQHVKTIEKRVLCNELRKELERKRRHERLVQYQINKARIAERKQKEAAELKARIEAQQQREAEAAAALAAQRERERQDLVQAAQSLPRIPLKSAPEGLIELVSDDDDSDFEML
eukprot:tig00000525_g1963.t1